MHKYNKNAICCRERDWFPIVSDKHILSQALLDADFYQHHPQVSVADATATIFCLLPFLAATFRTQIHSFSAGGRRKRRKYYFIYLNVCLSGGLSIYEICVVRGKGKCIFPSELQFAFTLRPFRVQIGKVDELCLLMHVSTANDGIVNCDEIVS